ncbi:hypothetical protein [Glaciihabitans sp. GrIS 2.15]|uniref:hypothetical protein n=1 Tax=Glaciihabitans sp. GrIS 2.15 TaxID=3071710 RepID=UPI002E00FC1B|nr:hypothetical protein [Glaciihabitans sp. GrIS 2.15]
MTDDADEAHLQLRSHSLLHFAPGAGDWPALGHPSACGAFASSTALFEMQDAL